MLTQWRAGGSVAACTAPARAAPALGCDAAARADGRALRAGREQCALCLDAGDPARCRCAAAACPGGGAADVGQCTAGALRRRRIRAGTRRRGAGLCAEGAEGLSTYPGAPGGQWREDRFAGATAGSRCTDHLARDRTPGDGADRTAGTDHDPGDGRGGADHRTGGTDADHGDEPAGAVDPRQARMESPDSPHNPPHLFLIFHRFLKRPVIGADQHGHVAAEWAGRPSAAAGVK
ncbi:hypothetical protein G6F65_013933 [Rhizopus arrhizus]|nr:hypothetical protein G6F65_013933 [Rhizopus arrhizus]